MPDEDTKKLFADSGSALRTSMLAFVSYCFFCLLTLGVNAKHVFKDGGTVKIPFASVEVDYFSFLIFGILILGAIWIHFRLLLDNLRDPQFANLTAPIATLPLLNNLMARVLFAIIELILLPATLLLFAIRSTFYSTYHAWFIVAIVANSLLLWSEFQSHQSSKYRKGIHLVFVVATIATWLLYVFSPQVRDYSGIDMREFDYSLQDLSETDFSHSVFSGTNMSEADLSRSNFSHSNFAQSDLSNIEAFTTRWHNADLYGADCTEATLIGADFTGANLNECKFYGASLRECVFHECNFTDAKLNGADITGADFTRATGLTQEQIDSTKYDKMFHRKPKLPSGLRLPVFEP